MPMRLILPVLLSLMLCSGCGRLEESRERQMDSNNLKLIGLALHNYHDANNGFPPAAICDPDGKPLLSWRVTLLPYLEQGALYKQFKLDEPWDSQHNLPLSKTVVKVFQCPGDPDKTNPDTHYRVVYGNGAGFELTKKISLLDIKDGTSNTIAVLTTEQSVPWSKPDDIDFSGPLPKLATFFRSGSNVIFFDASVRMLRSDLSPDTLKALITRKGGESLADY